MTIKNFKVRNKKLDSTDIFDLLKKYSGYISAIQGSDTTTTKNDNSSIINEVNDVGKNILCTLDKNAICTGCIPFIITKNNYFLRDDDKIIILRSANVFLTINIVYIHNQEITDLSYSVAKFEIIKNDITIHSKFYGFDGLNTVAETLVLDFNNDDHIIFKLSGPQEIDKTSFIKIDVLS